jgi:hypothetical protein
MAGLNRNGFVLIAFGGMNLCMKMEEYYQKNVKEQIKAHYQPEASIPLVPQNEIDFKDKGIMYKEVYYSIDFFGQIIHEALQEFKKDNPKYYGLQK